MDICFAFPAYDGKIPVEAAVHLVESVIELREAQVDASFQWGVGSALIDLCRNRLVKKFLEKTDSDKLLFIDSDIIFKAEDVTRLAWHSQKYAIVGATYPVRKEPAKFFLKAKGDSLETNQDGLIEVEGFGAGFVMIDRNVFTRMKPLVPEIDFEGEPMTWYFDTRIIGRRFLGEDISFYKRYIDECNGKVFIDPYINLKHVGPKEFDYKLIDYLNNKLERVN